MTIEWALVSTCRHCHARHVLVFGQTMEPLGIGDDGRPALVAVLCPNCDTPEVDAVAAITARVAHARMEGN